MPARTLFITGTDTGVGKTLVTTALLTAAARAGMRSIGLKPVAAGCARVNGELRNEDALALRQSATVSIPYVEINPVPLEPAVAPHLAAAEAGQKITAADLIAHCEKFRTAEVDLLLIEGAGGWLVPLNDAETLADVCMGMGVPAVLVVGMRLGCINHALLTVGACIESGVPLAAWVANCVDPQMEALEGNIETLRQRIPAPLLGTIPFLDDAACADDVAGYLTTSELFAS